MSSKYLSKLGSYTSWECSNTLVYQPGARFMLQQFWHICKDVPASPPHRRASRRPYTALFLTSSSLSLIISTKRGSKCWRKGWRTPCRGSRLSAMAMAMRMGSSPVKQGANVAGFSALPRVGSTSPAYSNNISSCSASFSAPSSPPSASSTCWQAHSPFIIFWTQATIISFSRLVRHQAQQSQSDLRHQLLL